MERLFITTKIVAVEEMDAFTFATTIRPIPAFQVVCGPDGKGQPGYKVRYPDGYVSWSPKEVLEQTGREISPAEVSTVINAVLYGPPRVPVDDSSISGKEE